MRAPTSSWSKGAGGALAPLGRLDMLDIARVLGLPVLMVVGVRLGCLNHALMTALAIRARGLKLVGWVANSIDPSMARGDENVAALECRLSAPRLANIGCSRADAPNGARSARLQLFASRRSMLRSAGFS